MKNIFCFRVFYHGKCSLFPIYYIMRQSNKISFIGVVLVGIVKINPVHCIFGFVEDNGFKIFHIRLLIRIRLVHICNNIAIFLNYGIKNVLNIIILIPFVQN